MPSMKSVSKQQMMEFLISYENGQIVRLVAEGMAMFIDLAMGRPFPDSTIASYRLSTADSEEGDFRILNLENEAANV